MLSICSKWNLYFKWKTAESRSSSFNEETRLCVKHRKITATNGVSSVNLWNSTHIHQFISFFLSIFPGTFKSIAEWNFQPLFQLWRKVLENFSWRNQKRENYEWNKSEANYIYFILFLSHPIFTIISSFVLMHML